MLSAASSAVTGSCLGNCTMTDLKLRLAGPDVERSFEACSVGFRGLRARFRLERGLEGEATAGVDLERASTLVATALEPGREAAHRRFGVAARAQLVGLSRKPCLLMSRSRPANAAVCPCKIVGRTLVTVTRAVYGSTVIVARVTTLPRLNGPATAGTTIDRPNGAPL